MSLQTENKALVERYFNEVIAKHNLDAIEEFIPAEAIDHSVPPGTPQGAAGTRIAFTNFFNAFPDFEDKIDFAIADGDKVVAHVKFSGTHQGEFQGMKATGKHFTTNGIEVLRIADGKLVERWFWFDTMGMLQQLGIMGG